ncbi:MAG TPA: N-acetyltransferase [Spirochaetia bacterium]|nr:N-acetyltransferase [Spirochaetia bacterium]
MQDCLVSYRKARIDDVGAIQSQINYYAGIGLMLARSLSMLYESIREFTVVVVDDKVVGTGSLHITWKDLAEVRALTVDPDYVRRGIGRNLVRVLLAEAQQLGIPRVFALTYKEEFFRKCGFLTVAKDELPQKVWRECIDCPKFPNCEETAVLINLRLEEGKDSL